MSKHVIVIGGGVAGLEAAGQLSKAGIEVSVIEKENKTGGHLNKWYKLFPDRRNSGEVKEYLDSISVNDGIKLFTNTTVEKFDRNKTNFSIITNKGKELTADAVIVATGFELFKSARKEEYGYGIYDNVITSADLEEMFRKGEILLCNGKSPKTVGIVHCVGSRDEKVGNLYCSKLCCVTAVKQAIEIREHLPDSKVFCFYMDMRMGGAHYEELYREAQEEWGVNFIRGKVSEAGETINNKLVIKVEDTLAGRPLKMELDMLVLMAGMEMSEGGRKIAGMGGLKTGENRFFAAIDPHYGSNRSNIKGVFYAGTCTCPMNITETISHARAAVSEVTDYLKDG
ncbi:MAG: CoB--CoM heterodisulfide reductase iron-sulfur subunit A family protein [Bacteroidetes bacterium]|nr:MAG: CoB--CoM heterodisulfide reductase iron-sulfur subunit A family protein [Bacteroidota bacterium]